MQTKFKYVGSKLIFKRKTSTCFSRLVQLSVLCLALFALQAFPWQKKCVTVMCVRNLCIPILQPSHHLQYPHSAVFRSVKDKGYAVVCNLTTGLFAEFERDLLWKKPFIFFLIIIIFFYIQYCCLNDDHNWLRHLLILKEWSRIVLIEDDECVKSNVRGILGLARNRKSARNVSQNWKTAIKIAQNRKSPNIMHDSQTLIYQAWYSVK